MGLIRNLLSIVGPPKDTSPEAGLSGDLDELPVDVKDGKDDDMPEAVDITEDD